MTLHTDIPVQADDIRVGDYVIGTMTSPWTDVEQGYVTAVTDRSIEVGPHSLGREVRTFQRRVNAQDPDLHLVDPQAIRDGDVISIENLQGQPVMLLGMVTGVNTGNGCRDLIIDGGQVRCTAGGDLTRQYFRRNPSAPVPEAPAEWVQVPAAELLPGDYARGSFSGDLDAVAGTVERTADGFVYFIDNPGGWDYERTWERRARTNEAPRTIWNPIPFVDLQVGDQVRSTYTRSDGTQLVTGGTITGTSILRAYFTTTEGVATSGSSNRKWEVSNRVPAPRSATQDLYPTIHHLKAKLFDITMANFRSGVWCSDASDFAQEYDLCTNLYEDGLQDQQRQVENLLAQLRGEWSEIRGISPVSLDRAFEALGVPRAPVTKRVQLEIEVPASLTPGQISEMIASQSNITEIRQQEVPR